MERNSSRNLETSISSIRIEFESTEVRETIPNQTTDKILTIGGEGGSSGAIDRERNNLRSATSSVIDAIRFNPSFESQLTSVTGGSEVDV